MPVSQLHVCPVCGVSVRKMARVENPESVQGEEKESKTETAAAPGASLAYDPEFARIGTGERYMDEIHQMAVSGTSIIEAMSTPHAYAGLGRHPVFRGPSWTQCPLDEHAPVASRTVIGKKAAKPMVLENPVYISHMSFGALSRETKTALARGSAMAQTAMCSGEGGGSSGGTGSGL